VPAGLLEGCDAVPIPGEPDLMHQKYVVRDAESVWTGSTNWTNDSWSLEENVIVRIDSAAVAAAFAADFAELWAKREVAPTGRYRPEWIGLPGGIQARPYFTPYRAQKLVHEIGQRLSTAERRIRICSPVLTDGPILGTLAQLVADGVKVDARGIFDATQMAEVRHQWGQNPLAGWKIQALNQVQRAIPFSGKVSTPWAQGSVHDYMHAKFTVVDDFVFVGSYNLSHSGEQNAENVVEFESAGLADLFVEFADRIIARYPPAAVP
jgi:phosphatidylserine/phosphatidylglycerophosphate/cardiolipin synthase-like enzyme